MKYDDYKEDAFGFDDNELSVTSDWVNWKNRKNVKMQMRKTRSEWKGDDEV